MIWPLEPRNNAESVIRIGNLKQCIRGFSLQSTVTVGLIPRLQIASSEFKGLNDRTFSVLCRRDSVFDLV